MCNCRGECCVCACGGCCLAGNGDDDFTPASKEKIIENLDNNRYPRYREYMIKYLKEKYRIDYIKNKESKSKNKQNEGTGTNEERVLIYINETKQYTTAKLRLESMYGWDLWVAVLDDIAHLKPFKMFSNVHIIFSDRVVEAGFYFANNSRLIQKDSKSLDFWFKEDNKESEGKPMTHNVTVKKTENKVIEEYWVLRGFTERNYMEYNSKTKKSMPVNDITKVEKEFKQEPIKEEIAQFLSDSSADFASVEHNYRFVPDLPFK